MRFFILLLLLSTIFAYEIDLKYYKGFYLSDGTYYQMVETTIKPISNTIFIQKLSVYNYEISMNRGVTYSKVSDLDVRLGKIPLIHLVKGTKCNPGRIDCKQRFVMAVYPTDHKEIVLHKMIFKFELNNKERTSIEKSIKWRILPRDSKPIKKNENTIIRYYQHGEEVNIIDSSKTAIIKIFPGTPIEIHRIDMISDPGCLTIYNTNDNDQHQCQKIDNVIKLLENEGNTMVYRYLPISRINKKVVFKIYYSLKITNKNQRKYWSFDDWDHYSKLSKFIDFNRKKFKKRFEKVNTFTTEAIDHETHYHISTIVIGWIGMAIIGILICIFIIYLFCYGKPKKNKKRRIINQKIISYADRNKNN